MKRIIIAGGTGFLGTELTKFLKKDFEEIIILSRGKHTNTDKIKYVDWDAKNLGNWCKYLDDSDVIINLTGKNINCRYTPENKKLILSSRIDATAIIGKAIQLCKTPPLLWINGSAAGIYKESFDVPMTENDGISGNDFFAEVCKAWEKTFYESVTPNTRKVALRTVPVFGKKEGVFPILNKLAKIGLGGKIGSGKQQISWIHILDFCRMIDWVIKNKSDEGNYNCAAPNSISNKNLMQLMRAKNNIIIGLPAASRMVKISAFFIGTDAGLILKSQNVVPAKAMQEGFEFKFGEIDNCLDNLMH